MLTKKRPNEKGKRFDRLAAPPNKQGKRKPPDGDPGSDKGGGTRGGARHQGEIGSARENSQRASNEDGELKSESGEKRFHGAPRVKGKRQRTRQSRKRGPAK